MRVIDRGAKCGRKAPGLRFRTEDLCRVGDSIQRIHSAASDVPTSLALLSRLTVQVFSLGAEKKQHCLPYYSQAFKFSTQNLVTISDIQGM